MWPASPTRRTAFTHPLLKDTGLFDYFELILSGDSLPKRKPDPLPLLHACEVFKVQPAELLLIGDSLNDTQAARAAGSPVFCVPYGYNRGRPVERARPGCGGAEPGRGGKLVLQSELSMEAIGNDKRWCDADDACRSRFSAFICSPFHVTCHD